MKLGSLDYISVAASFDLMLLTLKKSSTVKNDRPLKVIDLLLMESLDATSC